MNRTDNVFRRANALVFTTADISSLTLSHISSANQVSKIQINAKFLNYPLKIIFRGKYS